jgi:hypothetical protein
MPVRCLPSQRNGDPDTCPSFGLPGMVQPCTGCRGRVACILKFNESDFPIGILTVPQPTVIEEQRTEVDHEHAQSKYGHRIVNGPRFRKLSRTLSDCGLESGNYTHWKIRGVAQELLVITLLDSEVIRLRFPTLPRGLFGGLCGLTPRDPKSVELGLKLRVTSDNDGRETIRKIVNTCLPYHLNTQRRQSSS